MVDTNGVSAQGLHQVGIAGTLVEEGRPVGAGKRRLVQIVS